MDSEIETQDLFDSWAHVSLTQQQTHCSIYKIVSNATPVACLNFCKAWLSRNNPPFFGGLFPAEDWLQTSFPREENFFVKQLAHHIPLGIKGEKKRYDENHDCHEKERPGHWSISKQGITNCRQCGTHSICYCRPNEKLFNLVVLQDWIWVWGYTNIWRGRGVRLIR